MKVALIFLGGTERQNTFFWPSYNNCIAGYEHDLIVIHRNNIALPDKKEIINNDGNVLFENKIINGFDIPHRAFGAYRYYFYKFQNEYDFFIFMSDDVVLKRDFWIQDIVNQISIHDKCGFGSPHVFNRIEPPHIRAPFWFAKTEALKKIKWVFNSDHQGEMTIADYLTNAGYFGIQVGNKFNLGYDCFDHEGYIVSLMEKAVYQNQKLDTKNIPNELILENDIEVQSPFKHIGKQFVLRDLEPFNNLIYCHSLDIARKYINVKNIMNCSWVVNYD